MKRLTKIVPSLILLALLFATPVTADSDRESKWYERQLDRVGSAIGKEIIMVCTHPDKKSNSTLKYVDPFVGPLKAYRRRSRGWDEWSAPSENFVVHQYEVGD